MAVEVSQFPKTSILQPDDFRESLSNPEMLLNISSRDTFEKVIARDMQTAAIRTQLRTVRKETLFLTGTRNYHALEIGNDIYAYA